MEWISVEDRLPEEGVEVLTLDISTNEYRVDYVIKFENENEPYLWACRLVSDWYKVTHWMPLPSPPKDD